MRGESPLKTVTLTMGQASTVRKDESTELREHEWSTSSTRSCAPAKAVRCVRLESIAKKVGEVEDVFTDLSDDELREETDRFKERLEDGETLDDVMIEAFAAVREAAQRTLGQRPYDVQIMGGAALHRGRIAEMKTGEGKTLVATLPAYLNALSGKGVHVVTVNDYLAGYQSDLMGRVFRFLGLTTAVIKSGMTPEERRAQYAADITYGTNNEFGFDYLRDNMALQARGAGPARSLLRDRRRGRLDPHRRGPHPADHLRPRLRRRQQVVQRVREGRGAPAQGPRLRGRREEAHRRRARGRYRQGRGPPGHRQPLRVPEHAR